MLRPEHVQPLHMDEPAIIRAQAAARAWAACALTQGATDMSDADVLAGATAELLGLAAMQNGKLSRAR